MVLYLLFFPSRLSTIHASKAPPPPIGDFALSGCFLVEITDTDIYVLLLG